jgi:histidinol-phosphate aminotransferase
MTPFPRDDYRSLEKYDPGRRPVAVDLSDNTNLWGTHPAALERIQAASVNDVARYPLLYADVLRTAVGERFEVRPECVTTGAGSDDVLDSAFRAAASARSFVSYAAPTFSMVEPLALMNGMTARPVSWPDVLADPARLLERDPSVVYVCRPNNPTGELAPDDWVERLIRLCARKRLLLVLDEAYADFEGSSMAGLAVKADNVLVARTASKAYGLAGLRCGYGIASPRVALEIEKARGPYKVSTLAAEAVAEAIRDRDGWMAKTVMQCRKNRARLWPLLDVRGLRPIQSHTNFLLFRAPSGSATDDARSLRERGVAVRPFEGIPALGSALRVTIGPWDLMERFLVALDDVMAVLAREAVG